MSHPDWTPVRRDDPCPICERPDWCFIARDRSAAICGRVEEGAKSRAGGAGWLHELAPLDGFARPRRLVPTVRVTPPVGPPPDLADLVGRFRAAVVPARLARLARDLGLAAGALDRLEIGWCDDSRAWVFPMRGAEGQLLGVRLRTELGRKFAVRGGREGLFLPRDLDATGRLLVAEGPTDAAALLGLGYEAVGRPSCVGGVGHLIRLARRSRPTEVVILGDRDEPGRRGERPGWDGAVGLARHLALLCRRVAIILPPEGVKDARAWVGRGATRAQVDAAIDQAPGIRLVVRATTSTAPRARGGCLGDR